MAEATSRKPSCASTDDGMAALHAAFAHVMATADERFADRETRALGIANELVRAWLETELQRMAETFDDVVRVDGVPYRKHATGVKRYHTLVGAIHVRRASYREIGRHNGATAVPLEFAAGIVENATPALAYSVTRGFAERPLRHYEDEMAAAHREVPSRSTLERIGKRVGTRIREALPVIEPLARAQEAIDPVAQSISIGLDRTAVPMAETVDRPPRERTYRRQPPPPVVVAYRMAYVATLAIHDARGDAIDSKRFAATADEGPQELLNRLASEIRHIYAQRGELPLTVIQDGAPELWNLVDPWLVAHGWTASKLIDRYHVDERLAAVAEAITYDVPHRQALYAAWQRQLDRSDTAMVRICRRLSTFAIWLVCGATDGDPMPRYWRSRARRLIDSERGGILSENLAYLERYTSKMAYASQRARGQPIGSGVTEGACKSVIGMRCKRSGQRWFESGLSPCLRLRSLLLNRRLKACFGHVVAREIASLEAA